MLDNDYMYGSSAVITPIRKLYETSDEKIERLTRENDILVQQIAIERSARLDAEQRANEYKERLEALQNAPKRVRRKKCEIPEEEYSEYKSDGKLKARPADPIRSYEDFYNIQQYFLDKGKLRDWALWTVGVAFGLRISDLLSLKIKDILNEDLSFKPCIKVVEQKTSKMNNCLITEAVKVALTTYFDSIKWNFSADEYLFKSKKTGGKMCEEYGWKIISDAGKALDLPIVISSHTMRKSFANIAACVDKSHIDMNAITKIQGLLNHSDQRVTMRYLGKFQEMFNKARMAVSDFILGRTDVHELVAGDNYSIDDIVGKLDNLEQYILRNSEVK